MFRRAIWRYGTAARSIRRYGPYDLRETLAGLVGSPVPYGRSVGKHFVAKNGEYNSFIALSPMPGQSRGSAIVK